MKNKKTTHFLFAILFAVLFHFQNLFAQGTTFTLLHVNDTHSHLDAFGPKDSQLQGTIGGIAKAATVIGTLRASEPNVILLHAGDVFVGDPMFNMYFGVPEFQLMQQMGFDAMAVGNHEFDFGPAFLNQILSASFTSGSFPLLSANLDLTGYPALQNWIQPSVIKTIAGIKIGIFGMTIPDLPTENPAPVIINNNIIQIAQNTVNHLRTNGADVVICLSHLGLYLDKVVVQNSSGIDFVIGGHDHYLLQQAVSVTNLNNVAVPIYQAGENYKYIGKLHFTVNAGAVSINDYAIVNVDQSVPAYPAIQSVIESLKPGVIAQFGDIYHHSIGSVNQQLEYRFDTSSAKRDSPLGNLITDAYRNVTSTDIAADPEGLIRDDLYRGQIVGADVFRSMSIVGGFVPGPPADHFVGLNLATFSITGAELVHAMEIGLSQLGIANDFFLQYSGLRFQYDPAKPVGQRVIIGSIKLNNGKRFNPASTYTMTVNAGVAGLISSLGVSVSNLQLRSEIEWEVVRDFIAAQGGKLNSYHSEGRIIEYTPSSQRLIYSDEAIPVTYFYGNYPNPFHQNTNFRFSLAQEGMVTFKIYDIMGREVDELFKGYYEAGEHEINWTTDAINSGIYFIKMETNQYSQSQKIVIEN